MELLSLFSLQVRTPLCSSSPKISIGKRRFPSRRGLTFPGSKKYPDCSNLKFLYFRAQASGLTKSNLEKPDVIKQEVQKKDKDLAFVAGATGRVGSRAVRELLKLGFRVRACVRSAQKAESLVQSVRQMKINTGDASGETQSVEKLEIVECDLENQDMIIPAIGNASVVLCCIGASEKEVFDITGPYRIDYQAAKNLIDAATVAQINHFILLTSLGTNKVGFPAAILNLFWGVLIWKRKAEEALIASGLPFTIVRPGGMERPTDAYKETHNIFLSTEDTLFGGQVSNLQVAELMAFMAKNRSLSYCKVVEVIAETTAPLTPMGELLAKIPSQRLDSSTSKGFHSASLPGPSPEPEAKSTSIEEELAQVKEARLTKPLSPYIMYEDLKPPTSPTPTPSTTPGITTGRYACAEQTVSKSSPSYAQTSLSESTSSAAENADSLVTIPGTTGTLEAKSANTEVQETQAPSPYTVYKDLKPPTSPTPTPSGSKEGFVASAPPAGAVLPSTAVSDSSKSAPIQVVGKDFPHVPTQKKSQLSPYYVYDDLKPPTSPSPSVPTVSLVSTSSADVAPPLSTISGNSSAQTSALDNPVDKQHSMEPKSRPFSPFAMYEDLKPPTSPIPSPKKF
ncbi:protein TIC 62, chloroplastic isoform X1 [Telopea speciosissima]|uniref:protein TIC 62, chloroplastic isoform X1 n=1 Tax=Telopea speciosissima TaxID=54955 RepID=UPI001CC50C54|nr:protein TIC 62, chloroplastic isoform X1 [Telopea speciosissima]